MRTRYFTFLYNECKRISCADVNSDQINQFIESKEGQRGLEAFCAMQNPMPVQSRPKKVSDLLSGFNHE